MIVEAELKTHHKRQSSNLLGMCSTMRNTEHVLKADLILDL